MSSFLRRAKRSSVVALSVTLLSGTVGIAKAQTCTGHGSFLRGPADVGGSVFRTQGRTMIDGRVAARFANTFFGSVSVSSVDYDNSNQNASVGSIELGKSFNLAAQGLSACPLLTGAYQLGPRVEESYASAELKEPSFALGGSAGVARAVSQSLTVVPFAGASYSFHWPNYSKVSSSGAFTETGYYGYWRADVGVGFVFVGGVTLRPIVMLPVRTTARASYGLTITVNFGGD